MKMRNPQREISRDSYKVIRPSLRPISLNAERSLTANLSMNRAIRALLLEAKKAF
jgi:hypothetical protein